MEVPKLAPLSLEDETVDIDHFLRHQYDSIDVANQELPALVEWLNSHLQWLIEEKLIAKQAVKEAEALAYAALASGETPTPDGVKRTDAVMTRMIALDDKVRKAHNRVARSTGWVTRLQNTLLALQLKIDLVRSSEATARKVFSAGRDEHDDENRS